MRSRDESPFGKLLIVKNAYQRGEYTEGRMNGQLLQVVFAAGDNAD